MHNYLNDLHSTIKNNWDKPALCFFQGETITFEGLARHIAKFQIFFDELGVKRGDKIALCAKNSNRWAVSFLAGTTYGAVVVPILSDFLPDSVNSLVDHSDSAILFTDEEIWNKLDITKMPKVKIVINPDDFRLLYYSEQNFKTIYDDLDKSFASKYPNGFGKEDLEFRVDDSNLNDLAVINYTSGTTSAPKGVMLSYKNISASIEYAINHVHCTAGETIVSMLPMAHIYGLVFEFLYPLTCGVCIYYLGKSPAPSLLLKAMKTVKPYVVITVPLVMEKIYKSSLKPALSKPAVKVLSHIPGLNQIIFKKVRGALAVAFGGNVRHFIMGGAALNPEVENCFHKIGLNYTIGYGMTEAAPLIAYEDWRKFAKGSCGKKVDCAEVRIDSDDPQRIAGEIQTKGDNICMGYYKNPEATEAAFTEDGFLKTGDLGVIDKEGNIYIKGRSKNMILSASGQNIYPEEIEDKLNSLALVAESVVVQKGDKLIALVHPDYDEAQTLNLGNNELADIMEQNRQELNSMIPAYSKVSEIRIHEEEFEKTPKKSIKRFLYTIND